MEQDSVRLLRECNSGVIMGIESIDRISKYVRNPEFRRCLIRCKHRHMNLGRDIKSQLKRLGVSCKQPHLATSLMARMEIRIKMLVSRSDKTAADLVTQGTNMGILSISRYLNQYPMAAEEIKEISNALIQSEQQLVEEIRVFL